VCGRGAQHRGGGRHASREVTEIFAALAPRSRRGQRFRGATRHLPNGASQQSRNIDQSDPPVATCPGVGRPNRPARTARACLNDGSVVSSRGYRVIRGGAPSASHSSKRLSTCTRVLVQSLAKIPRSSDREPPRNSCSAVRVRAWMVPSKANSKHAHSRTTPPTHVVALTFSAVKTAGDPHVPAHSFRGR